MSRQRHIEQLRLGLARNLTLDFFDESEISSLLSALETLDPRLLQKALALAYALSNASSSPVPKIITRIRAAAAVLEPADCELWLSRAFELLDAEGMEPFYRFISATDESALRSFSTTGAVRLAEVLQKIETYLRGLSGLDLKVAPADEAFTDAQTVHLPPSLDLFGDRQRNYRWYRILAALQWAQIIHGSFAPRHEAIEGHGGPEAADGLEAFFLGLPESGLCLDIYGLLEARRLIPLLGAEYPGLARDIADLWPEFLLSRPDCGTLSEKAALVEALYQLLLSGRVAGSVPEGVRKIVARILSAPVPGDAAGSVALLIDIAHPVEALQGSYERSLPAWFPPAIRPGRVAARLRELGRLRKRKLGEVLRRLEELPEEGPVVESGGVPDQPRDSIDPLREYLLIKGRLLAMDSDLQELLRDGGIPGGVVVKGRDVGAGSPIILEDMAAEETVAVEGGVLYDEWDYRRSDYRRKWCRIREEDLPCSDEPFVTETIRKYGGYVSQLKKGFEMLRLEQKMLRRQKEGDDLDLEAVIGAFADRRAGREPESGLFVRLDRRERSIAVLFLIDMSGSTKGWVNTAEKESLVLLCEALETLGDSYAIYGFSGMTRTKCDFYRIKGFDEEYGGVVKGRIAAITPKDYTRMGPALRHASRLLAAAEAKTKLLITLSDGKPEDWDAYKGEYGIEDTRKSLVEAREQGIHPFCITIDKEAGAYLPHMYGETNYILIDDPRLLPGRMTGIYRRLTT